MRLLLSLICLLALYTPANAQLLQQQVIHGEFPDPSIIEVNGTFYATASSNNWAPLFPVYKSSDLKTWTFVNYIFNKLPEWTVSDYWAPELFYNNGTFYCYYTARNKEGISGIGVATAKNIEEGFTDRGSILQWGNEAIDAFVYKEDKTLYVTWKAYGLTQGRPIEILASEISEDGLSLKGEAFNILTAEKNSWEDGGIEGQCIVKNNGYLYMIYSGNACCGGLCNYKVGVARAKNMRGPWEKYSGGPILEGNASWKCPGHGTALKTNDSWYYLYHAYSAKGFPYLGRSGLISELFWNEKNGWPYFKAIPETAEANIIKHNITDTFDGKSPARWWRYDVSGPSFTRVVKNGCLTLTDQNKDTNSAAGATLCVVPDAADFTVSTKVKPSNNALKGLVFYATTANSLGMGIKGNNMILWKIKGNQFTVLNTVKIDAKSAIYLKAEITNAYTITFSYSHDSKKWHSIANLADKTESVTGDNLAWWSWGMKTGLFVKADSTSTDNTGVFDEFKIVYKM